MRIATDIDVRPPLHKLIALLILSIVLVGIGILIWGFASRLNIEWAWLRVAQVKVSSEWPLAAETIRDWLPKMEGKSILSIDAPVVVSSLKSKPWVKSVMLKKEYPDRILIEVVTKRAEAIEMRRGQSFFVDEVGERIEKTSPSMLRALDLPVISFEKEQPSDPWQLTQVIGILSGLKRSLSANQAISQIVVGSYPYFKVFLAQPRVEVTFNVETWTAQLPILMLLLHSPPAPLRRAANLPLKIDLIFPKKAVVSSPLSQ